MTTTDEALPDFLRDPSPREATYTIVSVDDHVVEAPHMFEGRLPARLAARAPRIVSLGRGALVSRAHQGLPDVVTTKAGRRVWEYEGKIFAQVGLNAVVGHTDYSEHRFEPMSFDDVRPGCYDPAARVLDMDIAGIWSSVNFPWQIAGFCGSVLSASEDLELGHAVMRAWNDWIHEEWCIAHPDRFVPLGLTWLADPELGAAEILRNATRGFRAVEVDYPTRIRRGPTPRSSSVSVALTRPRSSRTTTSRTSPTGRRLASSASRCRRGCPTQAPAVFGCGVPTRRLI